MTTTTPNMSMVLPDDHASAELWGGLVNAALTLNDGHDHTPGKGVKVPVSGLNINADLTFSPTGTPRAITDLKAIDFAAVTAVSVAGLGGAFFLSDGSSGLVLNELYYRTVGGSNVRVTNGAALNVAAFAGGIGGDYAAVQALLDYDDPSDTYRFRQETATAVRQFAKVSAADVRLFEYKAAGATPVPTTSVTLKSPAALAASYSVTWPGAVPGSTSLVQMDNAGTLTASNTVANAATFSAAVTFATSISTPTIGNTPNFTGSVTMASTLGVTGLITATAGLTAAANQHVTVSGTGQFKHGTRTLSIPVTDLVADTTSAVVYNVSTSQGLRGNPDPISRALCGIRLVVGQRITAIRVFIRDNATGPTKLQATFNSVDATTGVLSAAIATSALSSGAGANQTLSMTGLTTTVAASTGYYVLIQTTTGAASDFIFGVEVDYDQP